MTGAASSLAATVTSIWRYPVKSMLGEELDAAELDGQAGVLGDRAFALIDGADGKVATAKNPRKWPNLFAFSSRLRRAADGSLALEITLNDGTTIDGAERDLDSRLSDAVGRPVTLAATKHATVLRERSARPSGWNAKSENYTPEIEDIGYRERVEEFPLREGTFFDAGLLHLVSASTLERFGRLDPAARFDSRRFRPNLLVDTGSGADFDERTWIGRSFAIGDEVRIRIAAATTRCVMITLAQSDLPVDRTILCTVAKNSDAQAGVYAKIERGGVVRRGDGLRMIESASA